MFGFLLFLLCVWLSLLLVKAIVETVVDPPARPNALKIAYLIVVIVAILWLAGFGGWTYTTNFHPWQHP
jgi:hypothetical protein